MWITGLVTERDCGSGGNLQPEVEVQRPWVGNERRNYKAARNG